MRPCLTGTRILFFQSFVIDGDLLLLSRDSYLRFLHCLGLCVKEPQHFSGGIWAFGVGIAAAATTAGPSVPSTMDNPMLGKYLAVIILVRGARIAVAIRHPSLLDDHIRVHPVSPAAPNKCRLPDVLFH